MCPLTLLSGRNKRVNFRGELVWVSVYEILEIMLQQSYKTKIYNSVTYVNFQFEKWYKVGYFVY